jgi:hypothetical protein
LVVAITLDGTSTGCSLSSGVVTFTGVGTCKVDANQAGNADYQAAAQIQQSFAISKRNQTIAFSSAVPANATVGGATYTASATAPGGTVTFSSGSPTICTSSGTNGAVFTFVGAGTCIVNADQAGNGTYNAAPQSQQTFTVGKGSQTIGFTSTVPPAAVVGGATYSPTANATSGLAVTFTSGSAAVCTTDGTTFTFVGAGACIVNANQAGNANWNAAPQAQQTFSVGKGSQTISFTSTVPSGATVGGATYTASATATSQLTVTFGSGSTSVCTSGGTNGATFTLVGAGTCVVNANQAGNANWNAAPQVQQTFSVTSPVVNPTITTVSPATLPHNGTVTTVTVSGTGFQAGLTVSLSDATYVVQTVTFVSATQFKVDIKNNYANNGTHVANLTVANPDGGTATKIGAINN